jgi:hypothetical protein
MIVSPINIQGGREMSIKRVVLVVLVASGVMLAVGVGPRLAGNAYALPPVQEPDPTGVTIPYPGRLADDAGQPVADGAYGFTFALYDAETGGESLWSEVQEGIAVQEGAFNVLLGSVNGIPVETLDGGERWLAVGVRGPGEVEFTDLTPRQRLSVASPAAPAAPSNGMACPHDHWGETWEGSTGWLTLRNTSTGNEAVLPGWLSGVYGHSETWAGVHGQSTNNIGVYGQSTNASGVDGHSANSYGGFFHSDNDHLDLALGGDVGRINAAENGNSQLYLSSNGDVTIKLDNDSGGGGANVLYIRSRGHLACSINDGGDLTCTGAKNAVVETTDYGTRKLYAMESPEVWFEDLGTASLVDGEAMVAFDPIFAETVNLEVDYHVFVTPLSQEPVLLFVTGKSATAFTVRGVTLDGEPSECTFDYRVAAKRLGYEDVRLEETTWQEGE